MELLWTAFALGLVGSLHCAGMCGPLAVALPVAGNSRLSFAASRLCYNAGRIVTYCLIGVAFGLLGRSFALAGLQRWASIAAGMVILIGGGLSLTRFRTAAVWATVGRLKKLFAALLRRRDFLSLFLLGTINGLLPCGLVYIAAAGATATGGVIAGITYMAAFGLGTLPLMLGLSLAGKPIQMRLRFRAQKLIPISVACLGLLLVLRGMSLGIPFVSPAGGQSPALERSCH